MNRLVGALIVVGLLFTLAPRPAIASEISDQIFLRVFGENSDAGDAFASVLGPQAADSPLREYALGFSMPQPAASGVPSLPVANPDSAMALAGLQPASAALVPASVTLPSIQAASAQPVSLDYYQAPRPAPVVPSVPSASAGDLKPDAAPAGTSGLVSFSPVLGGGEGFDASSDALGQSFGPNSVTVLPSLAVPVRVGPVHFTGRVSGATAQDPSLALRDDAYAAGANFNVQAGKRDVNLDVSSDVEHLTRNDAVPFASTNAGGNATWQVPSGGDAPILVPAFADVTKQTMRAAVAVPVTPRIQFNVQYNNQRLLGASGLGSVDAQAASLRRRADARDSAYAGRAFDLRAPVPLSRQRHSIQYVYADRRHRKLHRKILNVQDRRFGIMPVVLACACAALLFALCAVQLASDSFAASAARPGSLPRRVSPAWAMKVYGILDRVAPAPYVEETLARAALDGGDPAGALRYAVRLPPTPERNELLARVAQRQGEPILALEYFFAAPDIDAVQTRVDAIALRDPIAALELERRLRDRLEGLQTHPDALAEADWRMGLLAIEETWRLRPGGTQRADWNQRALRSFEVAHALAPFSARYGLAAANQAYATGNQAEALRLYSETLEQDPANADAIAGIGLVALQQGRRADAERYLSRARSIDANTPLVRALERGLQ